jgi:hypothetical protein
MKQLVGLILLSLFSLSLLAQPSIMGITPANNATNVPQVVTITVAFSAPIDTTQPFGQFYGYLTSIDTISGQHFSATADTMFLMVHLAPSRPYFIAFYWLPGQGELAIPYGYQFTTGSSFTGTTVSGTVTSNSPGTITPAYALVGLSDVDVQQGPPHFVAGAVADANGNFTIPNVPNGTLYPVAAKDANPDGNIDPSLGDAVGLGNAINVAGSPLTGLSLTLVAGFPMSYAVALDSATAFQGTNLPGYLLRRVSTWDADSAGNTRSDWQFYYYNPTQNSTAQVNVQSFMTGTKPGDPWSDFAMPILRTITNPAGAAASSVFVTNCENNGGLAFRNQSVPGNWVFRRSLQLGQLWYTNIPYQYVTDTTNFYWMAQYHFDIEITQDSSVNQKSMWFIGNYSTGAVVSALGVDPSDRAIPGSYSLDQNYPNPFNPSTVVSYQLPVAGQVKLVVYDLLGREVAVLVNEQKAPGRYDVQFNASGLSSGTYFYRLTAGQYAQSRKMVILK